MSFVLLQILAHFYNPLQHLLFLCKNFDKMELKSCCIINILTLFFSFTEGAVFCHGAKIFGTLGRRKNVRCLILFAKSNNTTTIIS